MAKKQLVFLTSCSDFGQAGLGGGGVGGGKSV